jgi:hypothetical protein
VQVEAAVAAMLELQTAARICEAKQMLWLSASLKVLVRRPTLLLACRRY